MSIASENAKQIRKGMEVHIDLSTNVDGAYTTITYIGGMKVVRANSTDQDDINAWPWRRIADFQGDGFPLDGTYQLWDEDTANSPTKGVVGIRTKLGEDRPYIVAVIHGEATGLTLRFASEGGTVEVDDNFYDIRDTVIVPADNGPDTVANVFIYFHPPDANHRIELIDMIPGVNFSLDNNDLISCTLALRSDLGLEKPSFPISEIEVRAYWPNDISDILSTLDEGVPLTYYAGYAGSYSTIRHFYLSEAVTTANKELVIKAEDASSRLDSYRVPMQIINFKTSEARRKVYAFFRNIIKSSGIETVSAQAAPPDDTNTQNYVGEGRAIFRERTAREYVQSIMNLCRPASPIWPEPSRIQFWPTFVDAGIPRISWQEPTAKWTIKESDCGEIQRMHERPVIALKTEDEQGVNSALTAESSLTPIFSDGGGSNPGVAGDSLKVTGGKTVIKNFAYEDIGYFWDYSASGQSVTWIWKRLNSIAFKPSKTTTKSGSGANETWKNKVSISGKRLLIEAGKNPLVVNSYTTHGRTIEVEPIVCGAVQRAVTEYSRRDVFPNYNQLFERSSTTGSFLWKGDPRMQPRDVFNFHRLNGTVETCTIECIELKHEGGGTTATISYRLGVV